MKKSDKKKAKKICRERLNGVCQITGDVNCEVHHIVPLAYGGTNDQVNLTLIRKDLHRAIHNDDLAVPSIYLNAVSRFRDIIRCAKVNHHTRKRKG